MDAGIKEKLKSQRLQDYQSQIFVLQMDIAALEAIGETEKAEQCKSTISMLEKSCKAVEAL